jgi:hypothetical protein
VGFLFAQRPRRRLHPDNNMNAIATDNPPKTEGEDPAFGRLTELYEWLGLDSDQAATAADADLACGWHAAESRAA